jgi:hypothetical protein
MSGRVVDPTGGGIDADKFLGGVPPRSRNRWHWDATPGEVPPDREVHVRPWQGLDHVLVNPGHRGAHVGVVPYPCHL